MRNMNSTEPNSLNRSRARVARLIKGRLIGLLAVLCLITGLASAGYGQSGRWTGKIQLRPSAGSRAQAEPAAPTGDEQATASHNSEQTGPEISPSAKKPTIVGSWLLTINVPDNTPPFDLFKGFWALTEDGILIASAQGDVTPAPFPSVTSQYGAWAQTGGHQFAATFKAVLYDLATGDNLGMFKLRQSMTLSESGDEWSGPFKLTVYDPDGNVAALVDGTAHASRIKVEPLE
jgi:hypothetical protein